MLRYFGNIETILKEIWSEYNIFCTKVMKDRMQLIIITVVKGSETSIP